MTHIAKRFNLSQVALVLLVATSISMAATPDAAKLKTELERLVSTGDTCRSNSKPAEALMWYRKSAQGGSAEGLYRGGALLLAGQSSNLPRQSLIPDVPEGVRFTFWAATNMHPQACLAMARIYRDGIGVKSNLVHAYAWLRLFSELDPAAGRVELDKLAPKVEPARLIEAQALAAQFKNRQWPPLPCKRIKDGDPRLTLSGLMVGARGALAVINHKTLAEGESAEMEIPHGQITVTCTEIRDQSVVVDIAGEAEARLISFR